ncbi:MFS transporter [Pararhizobium haloflavum]|uniref:MFS transporter n=1 Tax=Pararhizobium haloflavum TaxID=2037914 RepID=UPI000C17C3B8|nr:MFS transporter [Pararhizobium haloflavum]
MAGLITLALSYVLSQFYRSFLAVMTPTLADELGMTNAQFSLASGIWFVAFAAMQFIVGMSLDRFGPRRTASILLAFGGGGGALLFAVAWRPEIIVLAMALIGIGCSPLLMASLFIFARTYSPLRFAALASWFIAFGNAGNVLGAAPLAASVDAFGWRGSMFGLALASLVVAAGIFFLVRDPEQLEDGAGATGLAGYIELLKMPVLWAIIPLTAVNYAPAATIRGLWAGPYLADVFGANALAIGNVTFFMAIAMVVGSFAYGPLDTFFRTRKWVAFGGSLFSLAALMMLWLVPMPLFAMAVAALLVIGLFGMGYGVLMAHARAFFPAHLTGRGVTLMNFFSIGGAGVIQFITGPVFLAGSVPSDPTAGYSTLFGFYALLLAIGLAVYLFSRDARPAPPGEATARR